MDGHNTLKKNICLYILLLLSFYIFYVVKISLTWYCFIPEKALAKEYLKPWISVRSLFFSPSLRKAIPQEQEIWNYNSAGDKWYVALLWIINESRRALVLPSCPSVIQTVWHEQDTFARQVETHTNTYPDTQTPSPNPTKSSLLISLVLDY